MTKTAKQAIMDYFGVTLVPESLLKELEAIIKSAKPADAYDVPYTDYPAGFNLAIDEYETNLLAALYGEKS